MKGVIMGITGLNKKEVLERIEKGQVNTSPSSKTKTIKEIEEGKF